MGTVVRSLEKDRKKLGDFRPVLVPLGDCGLSVRFANELDGQANQLAVAAAHLLGNADLQGVTEICPSLVSVFIRYDPLKTSFLSLSNHVRMAIISQDFSLVQSTRTHEVEISYGGRDGPDLEFVAAELMLGKDEFVVRHNGAGLRVLAVGFAPGFVYCGLHKPEMHIPRRKELHRMVPAGSIIFAAGQTAITASNGPTGWHVIGRTNFRNFNAQNSPPTKMRAGDPVIFSGVMAK